MLFNFREKLNSSKFLVTAEVSPPKGTRFSVSLEDARQLKGIADALNVTDNQCSIMHMSSLAFSKLLLDDGHEPIMQLTCRDRNRIGLQSDLLGSICSGYPEHLLDDRGFSFMWRPSWFKARIRPRFRTAPSTCQKA